MAEESLLRHPNLLDHRMGQEQLQAGVGGELAGEDLRAQGLESRWRQLAQLVSPDVEWLRVLLLIIGLRGDNDVGTQGNGDVAVRIQVNLLCLEQARSFLRFGSDLDVAGKIEFELPAGLTLGTA